MYVKAPGSEKSGEGEVPNRTAWSRLPKIADPA